MKKIIAIVAMVCITSIALTQISCSNAAQRALTNYTNGLDNDSLFFICSNQTATLIATPPSGTPGWGFQWQKFNVAGNTWTPLANENGVPFSQQSGLQQGGYRVIIKDGSNTEVGTYIVWICKININPNVNIVNIPAGCGNVQLTGQINAGSITPYYNPPIENSNPNDAMIISNQTTITVCFTGLHSYVSDLGFYLVGPASCGSPTIPLSPNQGICNSADNFTNFCFSTSATNILDPCTYGSYSGTYGGSTSLGGSGLINWAPLYGCDASQAGWSVQVYDCNGIDVGTLTGASISFSGITVGGESTTYTYSSPPGFSSSIADNSCTPQSASIYTVPASPAVVVTFPTVYEWTASPPFPIPNSSSSLNILLSPGPTENTQFTLSLIGTHPGAACAGTSQSTKTFFYQTPGPAVITTPTTVFCEDGSPTNLTANVSGGTWSGVGITNATSGTFNPTTAGIGVHTITYTVPGNCTTPGTIELTVGNAGEAEVSSVEPLCTNSEAIVLTATPSGGVWSGTGIIDENTGNFDPSVAGAGVHTITYSISGSCAMEGSIDIMVSQYEQSSITAPSTLCINEAEVILSASPSGGTWSGSGVNNSGVFNPASAGEGSHTISYTLTGNCSQSSDVEIQVVGETTVAITSVEPLCDNANAITLSASVGGGTWSGNGIFNASSGVFDPSIAGVGSHTINYSISGVCPASGTITIVVNEFVQPEIIAPSSVCMNGETVTLTATPGGGVWSGSGVSSDGQFTPGAAGVGTAVVNYGLTSSCGGSSSVNIIVQALPSLNVSENSTICSGESTLLMASGASVYAWSPSVGLSSITAASPTASPTSTTTYTVIGTANGCSSTEQVTVNVNPLPNVVVNGPFVICVGESVNLSVAGLSSFSWSNSATLSSSNSSSPVATPPNSTDYIVSGVDANGCPGQATIHVQVIDVDFIYTPESGISPLEVQFINQSEGDSFIWDFGNGESLTNNVASEVLYMTYDTEGLYTVTLVVLSQLVQCSISYPVLVYSKPNIEFVPDVVTSDGSGKNDVFRVPVAGMKSVNIIIFDRWGKEVGTIDSPTGYWNPRDFSEGVYYYTMTAEGMDGSKFSKGGFFHVMK